MNKPEAPKPVEPYVSMLALQEEYLQLSQEAEALEREISTTTGPEGEGLLRDLVLLRRRIRRFERRARATGALLDENADRVLAQSMLDFWCLRQTYLERLSGRLREQVGSERALPLLASAPRLRDPMRLVPFDERSAPELPEDLPPFVGLNAFGANERDSAIFYGRDEAVAELTAMLKEHRLVIVAGPSGSGKSSLIMAGLMPALRAGAPEGSADWTYWPAILPGADPFAALLQSVRPAGRDPASWIAEQRAALEKAPEAIAALLSTAAGSERPSLLILDQIEELFSMVTDAEMRARFASAIVAASLSKGPPHHVILIVREDFLERLLKLEAFAALPVVGIAEFRPKPMTSAELRLAIEAPARSIGLKFDEGIVEDLVREVVNDPAALPLLQFALTQLWHRRKRNRITREAYAEVGRPAEALGRTAERIFAELKSLPNQNAARSIFLALVVPSVGDEFVRRRVRREALHELTDLGRVDRVLEAFTGAGLIRRTPGIEASDDRFDVMHEALLRNWQRLTEWLAEKRRSSERQIQVANRASTWDQSGRDKDHLAIGTAIAEAELFAEDDPLIREYFEASRQNGEKRTRQRRILIAIGMLVTVVALGVAIWAFVNLKWQNRLYDVETAANQQKASADRSKLAADLELDRVKNQLVSVQNLFNEVVGAGAPSLRPNQPLPANPPGGPGLWAIIWVGTPEGPLIGSPQNLAPVPPSQIQAHALYRVRANLALRDNYPSGPEYRLGNRRFGNGTVAPGSLIAAVEQARGYDRPAVRQYWLRVRVIPRVIIHYPNGPANEAEIARIVTRLRNIGYDAAAADPVPALQSESELRYYYPQDQILVNGLVARLQPLLDPQHPRVPVVARIQSAIRPDPGTLELWLDPSARSTE